MGRILQSRCISIVFYSFLFSQSTGFHSFTKTILRLRPNTLLVRNYQAKHDVSSAESSKYFIPSEQIDALKESVDLVSVIESYDLPKFKRTGDNRATCVCPFHDDTNPSLSIDGNRGIFKCFSCGVGGNVYSFLREYSKLEGEDIGFYKAVKLVNEKYANGFSLNLANTAYGKSPKNMEEYKMEQAKKQRILQANLIAAAFFEENLSLPGAGQARSHLRKRGINPNTVRAFSVGFAPECYFQRNISYDTTTWGKGSLVNHLKDKNFTAQEIFDAGLATRIKGKNNKNKQAKQDDNSAELDYSNLMDRFRGRIVIPIFDATGSKVLGFGGRILENPDEISDFKAAKYLNSPESPVFSKKNILFGQSMAKKSVKFWADQDSDISRPVIIVEGYMDAIALWQAGVREAVASMGTALTFKQLEAAAAIAGSRNGRIVLCLDNDSAGLNAIERLCTSNIISSITERLPIEILIATLPKNVKDPADYLELMKASGSPEEDFRKEVVDNSLEWSDWYIQNLVSSYDESSVRGAKGSFGDIFERLASFLSSYKNAAERTKRAIEVSALLSNILAGSEDDYQVSKTVRIQLETDLVEKAASLANSKAELSNRIISSNGGDGKDQSKLYNTARGDGNFGLDEREKLSSRALRQGAREEVSKGPEKGKPEQFAPSETPPDQAYDRKSLKGSRFRMTRNSQKKEPTLTPHFSGFEFSNENDARWLGVLDDKGKEREDRLLPKSMFNKFGEINELKQRKAVYFNSNEFHGHQFITQDAMKAGYKDEAVKRDPRIFEKGVGSLVQSNENIISVSAEDSLLNILSLYSSARMAIKTAIDVSYASGSDEKVEWSSAAKEWLFSCLIEQQSKIPSNIAGPADLQELRTYLSNRQDVFPGVFGPLVQVSKDAATDVVKQTPSKTDDIFEGILPVKKDDESDLDLETSTLMDDNPVMLPLQAVASSGNGVKESSESESIVSTPSFAGELDPFFDGSFHAFDSQSDSLVDVEERAQFSAQQVFSTLLWASARKRMSRMRYHLTQAVALLQESKEVEGESKVEETGKLLPEATREETTSLQFLNKTVSRKELEDFCTSLTIDIRDSAKKINGIADSNRRLSERLMELIVSSEESEGEISSVECNRLNKRLKDHMLEIGKWTTPDPEDTEDEAYEDMLERAQQEWGELYEDGRMWSPNDITSAPALEQGDEDSDMNHLTMIAAIDDKESLDEFVSRVDDEWGWIKGLDDEEETKSQPYSINFKSWDDLIPEDYSDADE